LFSNNFYLYSISKKQQFIILNNMRKLPLRLLATVLLSATFVFILDPVFAAVYQEKRGGGKPANGHRPSSNSHRPPSNSHRPSGNAHRPSMGHRQGRPVASRPPVYRPQRPVAVHRQPIYAYHYHAYRPYHWGSSWHPLGFFAAALATTAVAIAINNQHYYYDSGVYYAPASGGYNVVAAPIGATVTALPEGFSTIPVSGGGNYFYYGGDFYIQTNSGAYQVVAPPAGVVVANLPDGAQTTTIGGIQYMVYNDTYYQPVSQNGQDGYEVVDMDEQ
jgi:hypothetical protein